MATMVPFVRFRLQTRTPLSKYLLQFNGVLFYNYRRNSETRRVLLHVLISNLRSSGAKKRRVALHCIAPHRIVSRRVAPHRFQNQNLFVRANSAKCIRKFDYYIIWCALNDESPESRNHVS